MRRVEVMVPNRKCFIRDVRKIVRRNLLQTGTNFFFFIENVISVVYIIRLIPAYLTCERVLRVFCSDCMFVLAMFLVRKPYSCISFRVSRGVCSR